MAAGAAAFTACVSASASNTSTTAGVAPSLAMASALSADRVVPVTSWPAATKSGVSLRPIDPARSGQKDAHARVPITSSFRVI